MEINMQDPVLSGIEAVHGFGQPETLFGVGGIFTTVTDTLLYAVGLLSVIMIIVGGLRYVVSGGNAASVTTAKNTVLYAIVGLVVAVLAYALVNYVLGIFAPGSAGFTNT